MNICLCMYQKNDEKKIGTLVDGRILQLDKLYARRQLKFIYKDIKDFLSAGQDAKKVLETLLQSSENIEEYLLDSKAIKLLPPIEDPNKIICLVGNYMSHIKEGAKEKATIPTRINVFQKTNVAITSPTSDIIIPDEVDKLDYELELGFVIGKKGKYIPKENAHKHIAGYFVANDISDRGYLPKNGGMIEWFPMKARDNTLPFGPSVLLSNKDISLENLEMDIKINGELRQKVNPMEMIFKPEDIVVQLSKWVTLEVGDIILTGTPSGSRGWSPLPFLVDGDIMEASMKNVGSICNKVVFEKMEYQV